MENKHEVEEMGEKKKKDTHTPSISISSEYL
jgi:hypothetical protein